MFCLSAQCRDPSPDRRLGRRASPNRTAGEVEASPDSDSAADCRAQLEERRRPVLCITATFSPSHRSCPDAVSPPCSLAWPRRKRGAVATRTCPKKPVLKYPLGAAAEQPRRPPDLVQRFPGAHVGRRCKRDQNLAPQNARRGRLKDPTRTTKNEPNAPPAATRTALRLLRRAGPSAEPSAPARLETTRRVRLHLEPQKTRFDSGPDVLAPGCGSILSTETPGNRPGDVAG